MSEADYKSACRAYVEETLVKSQSEEDRSATRLVLSNPMDLTTASGILLSGERPTMTNLQEHQVRQMSGEFKDTHQGQEFPLKRFAESTYEKRLRDDPTLDTNRFFAPIQTMVKYKLALAQHDKDADGKATEKWLLRHDKIRDYFLLQAFLEDEDTRIPKHIDDSRFRSVYLMLASLLPLEQARFLKDSLVERAAETKDHYLSMRWCKY